MRDIIPSDLNASIVETVTINMLGDSGFPKLAVTKRTILLDGMMMYLLHADSDQTRFEYNLIKGRLIIYDATGEIIHRVEGSFPSFAEIPEGSQEMNIGGLACKVTDITHNGVRSRTAYVVIEQKPIIWFQERSDDQGVTEITVGRWIRTNINDWERFLTIGP